MPGRGGPGQPVRRSGGGADPLGGVHRGRPGRAVHRALCARLRAGNAGRTGVVRHLYRSRRLAASLGLGVNAGHDLDLDNLVLFRDLPHLDEVSIGHALISHALFVGLDRSVREYLQRACARGITRAEPRREPADPVRSALIHEARISRVRRGRDVFRHHSGLGDWLSAGADRGGAAPAAAPAAQSANRTSETTQRQAPPLDEAKVQSLTTILTSDPNNASATAAAGQHLLRRRAVERRHHLVRAHGEARARNVDASTDLGVSYYY